MRQEQQREKERATFFRTLEVTLGRGMGWSDSPTSEKAFRGRADAAAGRLAFQHVLDEHRADDNILLGLEGLIVGGNKLDNHFEGGGRRWNEASWWLQGEL